MRAIVTGLAIAGGIAILTWVAESVKRTRDAYRAIRSPAQLDADLKNTGHPPQTKRKRRACWLKRWRRSLRTGFLR